MTRQHIFRVPHMTRQPQRSRRQSTPLHYCCTPLTASFFFSSSFQPLPLSRSYRKSPTKYIEKQEHPNPYPSPNATMRATSTALLLFSVPYAAAFVPATPLSARTSIPSHAAGLNTLALAGPRSSAMVPQRHAASSLKMVDDQVIMGAGVAIAGLVFGAGLVYFTEKQGERTAQRGGISDDVSFCCTVQYCTVQFCTVGLYYAGPTFVALVNEIRLKSARCARRSAEQLRNHCAVTIQRVNRRRGGGGG